eukprot:3962919-Pyramimonas_sp.AAC.1
MRNKKLDLFKSRTYLLCFGFILVIFVHSIFDSVQGAEQEAGPVQEPHILTGAEQEAGPVQEPHVRNRKLDLFKSRTYSQWQTERVEREAQKRAAYEKQQAEMAELQAYVDKWSAGTKAASAQVDGPIRRGKRAYTRRVVQSDEGRGHIPAEWTHQTRGEGIYPQGGPIIRRERAYTRRVVQSDEGRGHIPA